jgi:cysteine synthase A
MKIAHSIIDLIGHTPLLELTNYEKDHELNATVLGKLEFMNPAGSSKDRAAAGMIRDAEEKGELRPKSIIMEASSGDTGIALAALGATRGYHVVLMMPDDASEEQRARAEAYGAELSLTTADRGLAGAVQQAEAMHMFTSHSVMPGQFKNPANANAHYRTTGPEIWEDTDGRVDILVAGVGTGGTITGTGRYLKEKNPAVKIAAVDLKSGKATDATRGNLDAALVDETISVEDDVAFNACRELAQRDGVLVGVTSGAAVWAAGELAKRPENQGKTIVVILPDSGDRYVSTPVFRENQLL